MNYFICPDCDAIRDTQTAACSQCGRCASCGQRTAEGVINCECGFPGDEKVTRRIIARYGIPDESLEKEKFKRERLKKLEPLMNAGKILVLAVSLMLGFVTAYLILADVNQLIQVTCGIFLVSLLTFFYWAIFIGIGKVLFFVMGKFLPTNNKKAAR